MLDDANVDPKLTNAIGIVKQIFTTKCNESFEAKELIDKKRKQQLYIDALSRRKLKDIDNMSVEELEAKIAELDV